VKLALSAFAFVCLLAEPPAMAQAPSYETYTYNSNAATQPFGCSLYIPAVPSGTAGTMEHVPACQIASSASPGGRISDNSSSCAHTTDSTTIQTLYYLPCSNNYVPISIDGANLTIYTIPSSSTSLSLTNATNFPTNTIFDFYATISSGNVVYCAVPWGTSTAGSSARASLATITTLNGLQVNAGAWSCYNGGTTYTLVASEATLLGSFLTSTAQNVTVQFAPAAASGGVVCTIGYANIYNTQSATCISRDSKTTWTYASATIQQMDASTANQGNWIDPLGAYPYFCQATVAVKQTAQAAGGASVGCGINSITAFSGVVGNNGAVDPVSIIGTAAGTAPQTGGGLNYAAALQQYASASATYYGTGLTNANQAEALVLSTLY
jgi:hypothetical protein